MPTLTLPGDLSALEPISELVIAEARRAGLDKHDAYQLQLAVDELATNSIIHGYQEHGLEGELRVSADVDRGALKIVVEDTAVPYDPRQRDVALVEETFDDPLHERPIGGLGVYFVLQAVDEFDYEYVDGRNRCTLTVYAESDAGEATTSAAPAQAFRGEAT
jgi:anti-sigma regulatory factor (Ser/Thr protein kinase)